MKILFVYPNLGGQIGFNIGISVLSALLKNNGHQVRLIHLNELMGYPLDFSRIKSEVSSYAPHLIGISTNTNQFMTALKIAQFIKEKINKNIPIVFGGIHPTLVPDAVLSNDCVDMVVVGEGEYAMVEIAETLSKGSDPSTIKNVWLKNNGKVIRNPLRDYVDLEQLPFMDVHVWDYQKMIDLRNGWIDLFMSRGCPNRCTYCFNEAYRQVYRDNAENKNCGKYIRLDNYEKVIAGAKDIIATFPNVKSISFIDDDFLLFAKVNEYIRSFKRDIGLPFLINTHVNSIREDKLAALKEAGCDLIRVGVECGNVNIRSMVLGRKVSNDKIIERIGMVKKYGIRVLTYNMIGVPMETKENIMETMKLNATCSPDVVKVSTFFPYPGTDLYKICLENGLVDANLDGYGSTFFAPSMLKIPDALRLFIWKVQKEYDSFLNYCIPELTEEYEALVKTIEEMPSETYETKAAQNSICDRKERILKKIRSEGKLHYEFKFANLFAVLCKPEANPQVGKTHFAMGDSRKSSIGSPFTTRP